MQYLEQAILNCLLLCSQASKVIFALFWRGLVTDPSCSVLSKDEHALRFFTHHSLWFSTSVQSAEGGQPPPHTNHMCPSCLGVHHGPRTCFGKHWACVASRWLCQDVHCILAQKSNAKHQIEFLKTLVLLSSWCFSSAVIHTRATVASPSYE